MLTRLKTTLSGELDALRSGRQMPAPTATSGDAAVPATPKKTATPRKRKGKGGEDGGEEGGGSPTKRERKGKGVKNEEAEEAGEGDEMGKEVKEEEEEGEMETGEV